MALLAQAKAQAPAAAPAPTIHVNLQQGLTHMQEADPDAITASFKAWHEGITLQTPEAMAKLYATMSTQLRETGNTHNTGAQLLLVNTGDKQLHLISCLLDTPTTPVPGVPAASPLLASPHLVVAGNRTAEPNQWLFAPTTGLELFTKHTTKLASWGTIKALPKAAAAQQTCYSARSGPHEFSPALPLFGNTI